MTAQAHMAEPVAWRVRRLSDDPEEWQLRPAGAALDFGNPKRWEIQPLYTRPLCAADLLESARAVVAIENDTGMGVIGWGEAIDRLEAAIAKAAGAQS